MGRTKLSDRRLTEIKKINIGRIIIFCEGKTEKYYFDYFASIIDKNKYTEIKVVLETVGGNAQSVLTFANNYLKQEKNNQKFSTYGKYLVFDCDAPSDIQNVILASRGYELLISNHLFETWLLMHFENLDNILSKRKTYQRLSSYLRDSYKKGHKGKTREIIQNGSVEEAIDNAKLLERHYETLGKSIFSDIKEMNPYSNVYKLIEQFMVEIST